MNSPTPALVPQAAVRRLPRLPLLLLCAAYLLPGVFGRDPWKSADLSAFGYMWAMAQGWTDWWAPKLGGLPADGALLPYWLGAWSIQGLGGLMDAALAARLPFVALLAMTLALVWYSTYHLARTDAAQPLPFAFGGEANPVDYARAMADGSLLALIATLGLLRLGHETTPELVQLFAVALFLYGLSASAHRSIRPRAAVVLALLILAGSGGPFLSLLLGSTATVICKMSGIDRVRRFTPWVLLATLTAALLAVGIGAFADKTSSFEGRSAGSVLRQLLWFPWPTWPLALWTLWRWRRQWRKRHISIPLATAVVTLTVSMAMSASDRAMMLCLPALAILAAFALPTLGRSTAAAIDWFSVLFFTAVALFLWTYFLGLTIEWPVKAAANLKRLYPGFTASIPWVGLVIAVSGSLAWAWLVQWRAGRHRPALWRSLVLPASGVGLVWLLLNTVWLPLADHNLSLRPLVQSLSTKLPAGVCVDVADGNRALVAALQSQGGWHVGLAGAAKRSATQAPCPYLLVTEDARRPATAPEHSVLIGHGQHPSERHERVAVYRRAAGTDVEAVR